MAGSQDSHLWALAHTAGCARGRPGRPQCRAMAALDSVRGMGRRGDRPHLIAAASLNQWRWARSMFGARFRVDVHNQRRMVEQRGSTPAETPDRFRAIPPGCHRQHHRSLGTLRPTSVRPSCTPRTSAFLWDCPGQRVAGSGRIERVVHLVLGTGHQHGPPRAVCRPTRRPRRRHTAKARPRRRSVNRCCVEVKGLEPSTYGLQSRRSSS